MESPGVQVEKCKQYLQKLTEMDDLSMFAKPVNPSDVDGYDTIIKSPMDLCTISEKLEKGEYRSDGDLEDDVVLMITNALKFNSKGSIFYALGDKFRRCYHDIALSIGLAVDSDIAYIPSKRRRDENDDESTLMKAERKGVENLDEVLRGLKEDQEVSLDELRRKYQEAREKKKLEGYLSANSESSEESDITSERAESETSASSDSTEGSADSEASSEHTVTDSDEESSEVDDL